MLRVSVILVTLTVSALSAADSNSPAARFTDPDRKAKLQRAMPDVDKIFEQYAKDRGIPGMVWGVVVDGELVHVKSSGVRERAGNSEVTADTVFRIASMTKSFTALAILKLRDEGKLNIDDPVAKWIPEFARMQMPTRDSGPLRIRHLLTHNAGFPEDNPWGDQQLGATDAQLTEWLRKGIPFSTAPGMEYEYSNYGFGLLGRIVQKASGVAYQEYLDKQILAPLGMKASTLEVAKVAAASRAVGYRLLPDGSYEEEKPLPHGAFGAMGGLLTSANDLGRYVAFQLSAWPPRDDAEAGPVKRASVREMNHLWNPSALTASGNPLRAQVGGYGYGLRISMDCRFSHVVGHGGGLPGYGSYMAWLPEHGVGMFAMANLTYAGPAAPIGRAWDVLLKTGALKKRELPVAPVLTSMRQSIVKLWEKWDDAEAKKIAAMNLFLDVPVPQRQAEMARLKERVGACKAPDGIVVENWLRGGFDMACEKGTVRVIFTLAPTSPPQVQYLSFQRKPDGAPPLMTAPTSGANGSFCSSGE